MADERDYHIAHSPFEDGPSIAHLDELFGDVYEHPEYFGFGGDAESQARDREAARVLRRYRHVADSTPITVYRAAPRGVKNSVGVTGSRRLKSYAAQHAMHPDEERYDWPVYAATVPAGTVLTGGSDISSGGNSDHRCASGCPTWWSGRGIHHGHQRWRVPGVTTRIRAGQIPA